MRDNRFSLYDVAPDGPLTGVVLAGLGIVDVDSADYDATVLRTNIVLRWADTRACVSVAGYHGQLGRHWAMVISRRIRYWVQFTMNRSRAVLRVRDDGQSALAGDLVTWDANPLIR